MDYKYIEQLLERYFQAETTLQEEQILRTFFLKCPDDAPEPLRRYAPLFTVMAQQPSLDDSFDERILALTEGTVQVKARTVSMAQRFKPFLRAAAVVAVVLTLGNAIRQSVESDSSVWADPADFAAESPAATSEGPVMALEQGADSIVRAIEPNAVQEDSLLSGKID